MNKSGNCFFQIAFLLLLLLLVVVGVMIVERYLSIFYGVLGDSLVVI